MSEFTTLSLTSNSIESNCKSAKFTPYFDSVYTCPCIKPRVTNQYIFFAIAKKLNTHKGKSDGPQWKSDGPHLSLSNRWTPSPGQIWPSSQLNFNCFIFFTSSRRTVLAYLVYFRSQRCLEIIFKIQYTLSIFWKFSRVDEISNRRQLTRHGYLVIIF